MTWTRGTATMLLAASLLAVVAPAEALPANLKAFAIIRHHSYESGNHHASGRLRLVNTGSKDLKVNCTVSVTWTRANGDSIKRHDKITDIKVGAGTTRLLHFNVKLRDPDHLYDNLPTHAAPHCFLA